MSPRDPPEDRLGSDQCTTTSSFGDHGTEDGSVLIQRTCYRLSAEETPAFEPTGDFFERLESTFI